MAALLAMSHPAAAQTMCGPRATIVAQLESKYGEARIGSGLAGSAAVIEFFVSGETGSWTILRTDAWGLSCMLMAGDGWQSENSPPSKTKGRPI